MICRNRPLLCNRNQATKMNEIILVDTDGKQTGSMEKMEAHRKGILHRAFSIFIINSQGNLLLQQRADKKYHSGGLWSNTCCSHPAPGESLIQAAHRRLNEELGFECGLREVFAFTYKSNVGAGLIEHEYDHILVGLYDGSVHPNPEEVQAWKWISLHDLSTDISAVPHLYTDWLKLIFKLRFPELTKGIECLNTPSTSDYLSTK